MQRQYDQQMDDSNASSCCRLTVPFMLTALTLVMAYYYDYANILVMDFKQLEQGEIWRVFTSPVASVSQWDLVVNLVTCAMLTVISERAKGSVLHCIDMVAKTFLINSMALLLYIIVLSLSTLYEGSFDDIKNVQNANPIAGLQYLLILELFLALKDSGVAEEAAFKERFSKKTNLLMAVLLFVISMFYFRLIGLYSAIILGIMMRLGLFKFLPVFARSDAVLSLEQKLKSMEKIVYLSPRTIAGNDFYEPAEQVSIQSSKCMQSTASGAKINPSAEEDEFDTHEDELSKSRYEDDADVKDYVLEAKEGHAAKGEQESFEI